MNNNDKFYTAKYDIVFKTIMVHNENILKKLLEVILKINIDEIILLDKEISPMNFKGKTRILDMLIKSNNKMINLELNFKKEDWHNYRNAGYVFSEYNEGIRKDEEYQLLVNKEFISINLSYGLSKKKKIYDVYRLQNEDLEEFIKNLKIIEINMDKIEKDWYTLGNEEKESYKYLRMLNMDKKNLKDFCEGDAIMEKYESEVKKVNTNEEVRKFLTDEEDARFIRNTEIHIAYDEGMEKGINQGIEQTKKEMIKLLSESMTIEDISSKLKLSIEEINKIINS